MCKNIRYLNNDSMYRKLKFQFQLILFHSMVIHRLKRKNNLKYKHHQIEHIQRQYYIHTSLEKMTELQFQRRNLNLQFQYILLYRLYQ